MTGASCSPKLKRSEQVAGQTSVHAPHAVHRCDDNGRHLHLLQRAGCVEVDGIVWTGIHALVTSLGARIPLENEPLGPGVGERTPDDRRLLQSQVETVGTGGGADLRARATRRASVRHVFRFRLEHNRPTVISVPAGGLHPRAHQHLNPWIPFQAPRVDFQTTARRAELGKIMVETGDTPTDDRLFFDQHHLPSRLGHLQGRGQPCGSGANHEHRPLGKLAHLFLPDPTPIGRAVSVGSPNSAKRVHRNAKAKRASSSLA